MANDPCLRICARQTARATVNAGYDVDGRQCIRPVADTVGLVDARPVDPRDIGTEWDATTYRVHFWSADGSRCTEFELAGVEDLTEVLAWAEANANGRTAEIFVRHDHGTERGLIRISGARPGVG